MPFKLTGEIPIKFYSIILKKDCKVGDGRCDTQTSLVPFHQSRKWSLMAIVVDRPYDRRRFCSRVAERVLTFYTVYIQRQTHITLI